MIEVVKRVSGVDFKVNHAPRRAGDPAAIVAKAERVRERLGWKPKRDDLDAIVRQALDWERRLHNRLGPPRPALNRRRPSFRPSRRWSGFTSPASPCLDWAKRKSGERMRADGRRR